MNCNLVKTVTTKEKDGKKVQFTNFYLTFENGEILPVEVKTFKTSSTDKKEIARFEKINANNWVKLNCMADLLQKK